MNTIITIASGKLPYFDALRPFMERYAERVGAEFVILSKQTDEVFLHPKIPMLRYITEFAEKGTSGDRLLYVDADVMLKDEAPDIFALSGNGEANVWLAHAAFNRIKKRWRTWARRCYDELVPLDPYYNAGVILMDHAGAKAVSPHVGPPFLLGMMDQHQFNMAVRKSGVSVTVLDRKWNNFAGAHSETESSAYFVHFAGKKHIRMKKIRQSLSRMRNNSDPHTPNE